jgi:hypothetical protein
LLNEILESLSEDIIVSDFPLMKSSKDKNCFPYFFNHESPLLPNKFLNCFPQLLIPIKTKDDFVMPKEHVDLMNNYLAECTDMLIIGWKGQEASFLKTLQEQCGEKEINATFVTCCDLQPMNELMSKVPKLTPNIYLSKYFQ